MLKYIIDDNVSDDYKTLFTKTNYNFINLDYTFIIYQSFKNVAS